MDDSDPRSEIRIDDISTGDHPLFLQQPWADGRYGDPEADKDVDWELTTGAGCGTPAVDFRIGDSRYRIMATQIVMMFLRHHGDLQDAERPADKIDRGIETP